MTIPATIERGALPRILMEWRVDFPGQRIVVAALLSRTFLFPHLCAPPVKLTSAIVVVIFEQSKRYSQKRIETRVPPMIFHPKGLEWILNKIE